MKDLPSVLITGCSSGIGRAAADAMAARGWKVFATARKAEDLDALRAAGFEAVDLDMADAGSVAACAERVTATAGASLRGLVNNAGFGQPGALEDLDRDALRRQFEVNVFGLQDLTNRLLPGMIARGEGRIVHISSVVGRISLPFMGAYSATKFAVEALADAQRVELADTGVRVSLVEPGPITTRFSANAVDRGTATLKNDRSRFAPLYRRELERRTAARESRAFSRPPEAVAAKIVHALTSPRPRRRYKVTLPAHLGAGMSRFAPDGLIDAILARELRKQA